MTTPSVDERNIDQLVVSWEKTFKSGTDYDTWGQPVEATGIYQRLSKCIKEYTCAESETFTDEQKKILNKVAACLELRSGALVDPGFIKGISLEDLKKIESNLKQLVDSKPREFPVDVVAAQAHMHAQAAKRRSDAPLPLIRPQVHVDEDEDPEAVKSHGSLLPQPIPQEGMTTVTVRIEKIGLKEAAQFIDSFITVSVKDSHGVDVTSRQDTPITSQKDDQYIIFSVDVHIQRHLELMPKGFAIFFEFNHYKPKKKIVSTKCWTFLENDEIKEGPLALELYKKPTDKRRKRLGLLTVKPLFLHLKISLNV
ncbi:axin interactor, dorsalization-associated protein-like [Lineus longissimus]|uniref:axin interactor, dorsalization-associated protein-like n=1 Tax=Lineus longissimus TaxID=88925 RepID=UPI002B4FA37E